MNMKSPAKKPHFFKVLLGGFARQLKIPSKFVNHHLSGKSSAIVILHGPSGRNWHVGLRRTPAGTFLSTGWPTFVKDHLLKKCEFLVFRYDGNMHFSVLIFDTSGCEKEDVDSLEAKIKGNNIQSTKSYSIKRRRLVAEEESPKAKEPAAAAAAAYSYRSKHPYFVSRISTSSVSKSCTLRIPKSFNSQKHLPRRRANLVLRDPKGVAWKVVYIPYPPGYISAGWRAFVRGNNLEAGDYCACELVNPAELRINIFKAVQEDELSRDELEVEVDKDRMTREYRAQLDAERARKLSHGRNHSGSNSHHKKDGRDKGLKKLSSRKRKHKRSSYSSSSSSSSSESSSSDGDDEMETRRWRSRGSKKGRKHRPRAKHSSSDSEENGGSDSDYPSL